MTRLALVAILLISLLGAGAATAVATTGGLGHSTAATGAAGSAASGSVRVKLNVTKFVKTGNRLVAKGTAVATYTPKNGKPTVDTSPFSALVAVAPKGPKDPATCPVLTLELDQLSLDLLGLHVDLSKVILTITADSSGGVLGKLFCSVANAQTPLATNANARLLSHAARRSSLSRGGVGLGVPAARIQATGPGPCSIVDLLLGPLHLELLGLIVDLNQIHLQITADPNGGVLGSALCSIAPPPTTTATTAAAP